MDYVDDFEQDSGMESSPLYGSKDETPERKPTDELGSSKEAEVVGAKTDDVETNKPNPAAENPPKTMNNTVSRVDNYDDEPDETFMERLWGLTEMFPDKVTSVTSTIASTTWSGVKGLYLFSRTATWIIATSSVILFAPVLFELERAKVDEMQKSQQKQFLLGPNAAMLGTAGAPPPPPVPR